MNILLRTFIQLVFILYIYTCIHSKYIHSFTVTLYYMQTYIKMHYMDILPKKYTCSHTHSYIHLYFDILPNCTSAKKLIRCTYIHTYIHQSTHTESIQHAYIHTNITYMHYIYTHRKIHTYTPKSYCVHTYLYTTYPYILYIYPEMDTLHGNKIKI